MGVAGGWVIMAAFLALNKNLVVKRKGCHEAHSPAQSPSPPITMFMPPHSSYICTYVCVCMCACSVVSDSLQPHGLQPTRLLCPGIFQARILEWAAISFSRGSSPPKDQTHASCIGRHQQADSLPLSHQESPTSILTTPHF